VIVGRVRKTQPAGYLKQVAKIDPGNVPHRIFTYEFPKELMGDS
jgi:hypothetical protein